jgi:hypothetical protein
MQMRPFEYCPAAITARTPNLFYGVKYENNKDKPYLWKRTRFNGLTKHWAPDRTIYWGSVSSRQNCLGTDEYDVFFTISPSTHPQVLSNAGFNYAMASPHHVSKESETRRNKHVKLFCDSGGFQLISGALDWVDMDELVDTYNRTIDYGIGMDIPVPGPLQPKYLQRMCEVMLKNNKYLRSKADPRVEIYDVSHGNTLTLRSKFLERVLQQKKKDKIEGGGLAVGGIGQNWVDGGQAQTIVNGTVNLVYVLTKAKDAYERFHVLGTTGPYFQFIYHLILAGLNKIQITADSTSYIMPSTYNLIVTNKWPEHSLLSTELPKVDVSYTMPCNCPLCHHIKYTKEYHLSYMSNAIHGLYVMANQRDTIEETANRFLNGGLNLSQALNIATGDTSSMSKVYLAAARFAFDAAQQGFKPAWEKHEATLKSLMRDGIQKGALFSAKEKKHPREDRLISILKRFEDFHAGKG